MSRNFTADVDTQREYFNATYFNNSGVIQNAKYDTTLLKPFFNDPDKWKLAINRMRVPLSGIPLTKNNIPFHKWEVGLGFTTSKTTTIDEFQSYVPQLNGGITKETEYVITPSNLTLYYAGLTEIISSRTYASANLLWNNNKYYDYDNVYGGTIYALLGPELTPTGVACISLETGELLATLPVSFNTVLKSVGVDQTTGNVYLGLRELTGLSRIMIQSYNRVSKTSWTESMLYDIANPERLDPYGICVNNDCLVVTTYDSQQVILNAGIYTFQIGDGVYFNSYLVPSTSGVIVKATGNLLYAINPAGNAMTINTTTSFAITPVTTVSFSGTVNQNNPYLGVDNNGNVLINVGSQTVAYSPTGQLQYTFTPIPLSTIMIPYDAYPADAGPGNIFTYQTFLNQINSAFLKAFTDAKAELGATFLPTQAPEIIYNAQTKLFSLVAEGQYLTTNTDGSNQYIIYMNDTLWNQFYFPSNPYKSGYNSIMLQNYGINAFVGTGSATIPQFIYVQQEDSTIYSFYDLVRIIVGTTLIPVSGDGEGKTFSNTGFASNNSISMITDIVPDTTNLTPGSVLIYVPAGILRWYNLYAQQPFQRIDLILYYETKDGSIYPIEVINGEFFSVKLEFKKGPGDF
jgi:hypothetical protein